MTDHPYDLTRHESGNAICTRMERTSDLTGVRDRAVDRWALDEIADSLLETLVSLAADVGEEPADVCLRRTSAGVRVSVEGRAALVEVAPPLPRRQRSLRSVAHLVSS